VYLGRAAARPDGGDGVRNGAEQEEGPE
jgi:hypothetical protein